MTTPDNQKKLELEKEILKLTEENSQLKNNNIKILDLNDYKDMLENSELISDFLSPLPQMGIVEIIQNVRTLEIKKLQKEKIIE